MKYLLRAVIEMLTSIAVCCFSFYVGTIFFVLHLWIGFFQGLIIDDWTNFFIGLLGCLGHVAFIPFQYLYYRFYGEDKWYKYGDEI